MLPHPDPPVDPADCVSLAEDIVMRPFPGTPTGVDDWVIGRAQSGPDHHLVPIAASEVLEFATAERWAQAEDELEQRRRQVVSALTTAWGPPQLYSFEPDIERMVTSETLPSAMQDLALSSLRDHVDMWRRDNRMILVVLGQLDKHYPIVLILAAASPPSW